MVKKKISLITTGGTIASKEIAKGLFHSGAMTGEELASLFDLPEDIEVNIVNVMQKPSMHIDFSLMEKIRNEIIVQLKDESVSGVVVTHGTDTLEETAYFLDLTIRDHRPIVVTGSQRSPQDVGTDAYSNLRNSIYAAVDTGLHHVGVVVVFNERIYSAKYVKKVHASNLQGFHSFGYGYLGIIDNGRVSIYQKPVAREHYVLKRPFPRVDIIKCYAGADGIHLEASIGAGAKGIVLEGVGRGQVSPLMMAAIKKAIAGGTFVIVTTSAEEGSVYPTYSFSGSTHDLKQNGVILGEDYDSKKARIKLAVLLAAGEQVEQACF